ncbi:FAD-binding oxidoreductase [Thalassobaculum sp. OXR-137]|uniref:NAD(P)/FAD-dependent oxidoreductase n=1 Tax=Thalassobaculum sp. OXR-137 TaxID=3100173 RepID=UPI002AC9113A|nr:FAD-binding oxidoreductase [Thalassobaculum sp. OXR-137]WPZ33520.1 FAD-binding oxidoreductase [Thalassobaculum sp. OXR-137]
MSGPRIAVVGAGIVGASIAYHLAVRGAAVILVDAAEPAAGVTGRAFSWINIAHTRPHPYQALRQAAIGDWHRIEAELRGAVTVDWCGALSWDEDPAETERLVAHHVAAGYDVRLLGRAEISAVEPGLVEPPRGAAHAPGEGAVDPVAATRALCAAAREAGAELRFGARVVGLMETGGRVTGLALEAGEIAAEAVVLAAGVGSTDLARSVGVALPLRASPATLIRMRTPGPLVRGIVCSPALEVRQAGDTLMLSAADYIDDTPEHGPMAIGRRVLEAVRSGIRGAQDVELIDAVPGWRPMPQDGAPIVGFAPGIGGLYLAAMHAGIVLAPVVGRLAAAEILDGRAADALQPCRPERFRL